jgi:hypothetical protein
MKDKPRDWNELERMAGIERTVPRAYTQNDALRLTRKRLRGRKWRRILK